RQAVRHQVLILAFPGSNPGTPANVLDKWKMNKVTKEWLFLFSITNQNNPIIDSTIPISQTS
ncbi:hypothetical protein, partial [Xenorhabdus szentirmaii]|uniref:hypothetical protein n=1 Tax=Xenorhabdus szentirmaii TaxID=290112 RepID=UPI002B40AD1A